MTMKITNEGFDFGAHYHVNHHIGSGASGIVYHATHKPTGQSVAVKFLREEYRDDTDILQRFISERNNLITLSHPRIIRVHDLIADSGRLGIVMDYASGLTLNQYLQQKTTLSPTEALTIIHQILEGLAYAHSNGLVHRDIKPDNIILTSAGNQQNPGVIITDFGIASILGNSHNSSTRMVGTPAYMAPELIEHASVTPSIDIYATGIICYQLLTGRTPFSDGKESNPFTVANRHLLHSPPQIPGIGEQMHALLEVLLSKNPAARAEVEQVLPLVEAVFPEIVGKGPLPPLELDINTLHPATILKADSLFSADTAEINGNTTRGKRSSKQTVLAEKDTEITAPLERPVLAPVSPADTATVLKPQIELEQGNKELPSSTSSVSEKKAWWERFRIPIIGISATFLIGVVALIAWWLLPHNHSGAANEALQASLEDQVLPSGLTITRNAKWDPANETIAYTISYSNVKSPLSGEVMETFPGLEGDCLQPKWDSTNQANINKHSLALTSIDAKCAWTITLPKLSNHIPVTIKATLTPAAGPNTQNELDSWLRKISENTTKSLSDPKVVSTSYPLQRLESLKINIPGRIPQGEPIPFTIIGIWPNGENTVAPIYSSPTGGEPTSVLTDITGGDLEQLRLNDRCSGAVAISANGKDLAALYPANCTVGAQVGNYDLPESSLSIIGSGS